jgi:hypothetical protein
MYFLLCVVVKEYAQLLGICNGCVVRYIIGFDVGGPSSKLGLFAIGLGNVG